MKKILLKTLLIFILSLIIIYTLLTGLRFQNWCQKNQITIFINKPLDTSNLDNLKLEGLGKNVNQLKDLINSEDSELNKYDPTGYAVWLQMQSSVGEIFNYYTYLSILLGLAISIGYLVLNISQIKTFLKIILGYLLPVITLPIMYIYIFAITFNPFMSTLNRNNNILFFCISYTIIFLLMFIVKNTKIFKKKV